MRKLNNFMLLKEIILYIRKFNRQLFKHFTILSKNYYELREKFKAQSNKFKYRCLK